MALKSGYVDRLLRIMASQLNMRAPLLTAVLSSLADILSGCDPLMFKKITFGLGGVVRLGATHPTGPGQPRGFCAQVSADTGHCLALWDCGAFR